MADSTRVQALDFPVLSVEELSVSINGLPALRDVSFQIDAGETLAIVGESGSGKTLTSLALMGLLPKGVASVSSGKAILRSGHFRGELLGLDERRFEKIRGSKIAMIFQEPMTSLNPVHTIGRQISEVLKIHSDLSHSDINTRVLEMLDLVQIPDAARCFGRYPHELSGGMRQRVMIAIALACEPNLLIADEPTTALDVTIQAQILDLMAELQRELGTSILFITHDMGVVAQVADRVAVLYAGQVVETAPVKTILEYPKHPYTQALLRSIPNGPRADKLFALPGKVPALNERGHGCLFANRCGYVDERLCVSSRPLMCDVNRSHQVRCSRLDYMNEICP